MDRLTDNSLVEYLFVYGTLMRDYPGYHRFLSKMTSTGRNAVLEGAVMYRVGSPAGHNYPMVFLNDDKTKKVYGELFTVCDQTLYEQLDRYECVPHLYQRIQVFIKIDDTWVVAWVYIGAQTWDSPGGWSLTPLPSGDWKIESPMEVDSE